MRKHAKKTMMVLAAVALSAGAARAAVIGPYTADSNTLALYHFDEAAGTADPGNPIVNQVGGGSALNLTSTGGPDGRNNTGGGGYGAAGYSGFGSAFDVRASGDGTYHGGTGGSGTGGGLTTGAAVLQSDLHGAGGAFTYEALINLSGISTEQEILAHDGTAVRGFLFRVTAAGKLSLYPGFTGEVMATIPTTGEHRFAAGDWFHVAVTYTGEETATSATSDNVSFYWTALDSGVGEANLIGTAKLTADLTPTISNLLGVGTSTRSPFRFEPGLVDEVRISGVARGADDFMFAVPEPGSMALLGVGGLLLLARRRA